MDRLTKVTGNDKVKLINFSDEVEEKYPDFSERLELMFEKLAYYEDLDEQGKLPKLPCKVEDTLYEISMGKIINLTVNEISIFRMKGEKIINVKCQNNDEFRNYVEREFGKTVFLTKSEAEAELKSYLKKYNKDVERD